RAEKPEWWAMFDRQDRTTDELVDDAECLGDLRADPAVPPAQDKQSLVYTFRFPAQDCKLAVGDECLIAAPLTPAGTISALDHDAGIVQIRRGKRRGPPPDALSVIPAGPINSRVLKEALYRFADAVIADNQR